MVVPMKSTVYLYGTTPDAWADLPYKDALVVRKNLAKGLLHRLSAENQDLIAAGAGTREQYQALQFRIKNVYDAISHNDKLLKELDDI